MGSDRQPHPLNWNLDAGPDRPHPPGATQRARPRVPMQTTERARRLRHRSTLVAGLLLATHALADGTTSLAMEGKDGWLFGRHEIPLIEKKPDISLAVRLIARLNQVLAKEHTHLVMSVIPSKIETHAEHLPDDFSIPPHMARWYGDLIADLRQQGVHAVDLKPAMLKAAQDWRVDLPYFKYDTHWTPLGATVAAWAIRQDLITQPDIVQALDELKTEKMRLRWQAKAMPQMANRDMANLFADNATRFPVESVRRSSLKRLGTQSLLDDGGLEHMALVGSSMSGEGSGFADGLRYSFQREVFNYAINADVGPWVAIRNYLRFVSQKEMVPKVIIWEMPERALSQLPSNPLRQAQYRLLDTDWLLEVLAYADRQCQPPPNGAQAQAEKIQTDTTEGFLIRVAPGMPAAYASVRASTEALSLVDVEYTSTQGTKTTRPLTLPGDDASYLLKLPLAIGDQPAQEVKLVPANGSKLLLESIQTCAYPVSVQP